MPLRGFAPGAVHSSGAYQEYHAHLPRATPNAHGAVHSPGAYQEYHAHLPRATQNEDGFSERPIWSNPAAQMDASLAHSFS